MIPTMLVSLLASIILLFCIAHIPTATAQQQAPVPSSCTPITTVPDFDLDQYASKPWYSHQQAINSYSPITQNYCVKAEYNVRSDPTFWGYTVDVFNQARDSDASNNELNLQQGNLCAYQTDLVPDGSSTVNDAKLAVAPCFLPKAFSGPYWIVAYDEIRGYALISGGQPDLPSYDSQQQFMGCTTGKGVNNSGLWIFSRSSDRDEELISDVRDIAFSMGFDVSVLNDVDQSAGLCGYDDGAGDSASVVPTGDPSAVPTFSPSDGTGVMCEDGRESFSNWLWFGPDRDCDWVEDGAFFRCFFYAEYCPDSCGRCD